jgi:hypothetical protein
VRTCLHVYLIKVLRRGVCDQRSVRNFYCVDDSFGTVNPIIDFSNRPGGTYDVWIASNTTVSGTLYLTENSGNHP